MSSHTLIKFSSHWLQNRGVAFYGVIIFAVCSGMLIIGLWPFDFRPANNVMWLGDRNGINFYGNGAVTSVDSWNNKQNPLFPDKSISMELWLRPLTETNSLPTILTLYDEKTPYIFFIGQWRSHLAIRSRTDDPDARKPGKGYQEIGLSNALLKNIDTFITITSGPEGTAIYQNGVRARFSPRHRLLAGYKGEPFRLILGNSYSTGSYWIGYLSGLAIYNRTLTHRDVSRSYLDWIHKGIPPMEESGCIALYLFDEKKGAIVYDHMSYGRQLIIPEIFTPVNLTALHFPWHDDFQWNRSFFQDVIINIAGFIPFGFFCACLLVRIRKFGIAAIYTITVFSGLALSLLIELLQIYLPGRDSSMTDLICNIVGTVMGLIIFHATMYSSQVSKR